MTRQASVKYCQKSKRLKKSLVQGIKILLKKKKNKKWEYGHERYKNLSEDEKQKLIEHRKRHEMWKITERLFSKVLVSRYKSEKCLVLGRYRFSF